MPFEKGLSGHSDGDALVHAVIDALLGGAGLGDIGTHFPSSHARYKDVQSTGLLGRTVDMVRERGWQVAYVDATILAERPVLRPFLGRIQQRLAASLGIENDLVNVKAKTTDGLGLIGRGEGIAALAIATLERA